VIILLVDVLLFTLIIIYGCLIFGHDSIV